MLHESPEDSANDLQYRTLRDFTKVAAGEEIEYVEDMTANFEDSRFKEGSKEGNDTINSSLPEVENSGFFSRDYRVIKNCTYGTLDDQKLMIIEQLKEQHGYYEESSNRSGSFTNSNLEQIDECEENE